MSTGAILRTNTKIKQVERKGNIDRYGNASYVTVPTKELRARIEKTTRRIRSIQGDVSTVDGTITVGPNVEIEEGDRITLSDDSRWDVFLREESQDVFGRTKLMHYAVTKLRKAYG